MSHTPGKWEVYRLQQETEIRVSSEGPLIAQCNWSNPDVDDNARLISAAPALLAALRGIMDQACIEGCPEFTDKETGQDVVLHTDECIAALAAIAAATKETP